MNIEEDDKGLYVLLDLGSLDGTLAVEVHVNVPEYMYHDESVSIRKMTKGEEDWGKRSKEHTDDVVQWMIHAYARPHYPLIRMH